MNLRIPKKELKDFHFTSSSFQYKRKKIAHYSFGTGKHVIFSFPAYPHSGLMYLNFLRNYKGMDSFKFITFDIPGWVGDSENIFENSYFNYEDLINIADILLKKNKVKKFSVIGFSFGSSLALNLIDQKHKDINKVVIVSPLLDGKIVRSYIFNIVTMIEKFRWFVLVKTYLYLRFQIYLWSFRKYLPQEFEIMYSDYINLIGNSNSKVIIDSLYLLYHSDFANKLKQIRSNNILIVSSKNELKFLRKQSQHVRQILEGENSLYIHGHHEDFILNPTGKTVNAVMEFLK